MVKSLLPVELFWSISYIRDTLGKSYDSLWWIFTLVLVWVDQPKRKGKPKKETTPTKDQYLSSKRNRQPDVNEYEMSADKDRRTTSR